MVGTFDPQDVLIKEVDQGLLCDTVRAVLGVGLLAARHLNQTKTRRGGGVVGSLLG